MSPAQVRQRHRSILWSAGLVLTAAVVLVLLPSPEQSEADTRTRPGTITQTITYVGTKPEERRKCLSWDWYGQCERWKVWTVMVPCTPGSDPACSNISTQIRLACSGFWAGGLGSDCREYVSHTHVPPATTSTTTTTTAPTTTTSSSTTTSTSTTTTTTIGGGGGPQCTGDTHAFGSRCHADHRPRPACLDGVSQTYTYHSGGGHRTGTVPPCPTTTTTTTTTTQAATTTTAVSPVCSSGLSAAQEQELRDLIGDLVGWETSFPNDGSVDAVWSGDEPPQAGGSFWFIASDKVSSPASAEPPVWPVADGVAVEAVEDDAGCWWYPVETWSRWNSLKPWSHVDRLRIGSVAQDWVDRWNRMSSDEQQETRARWEELERAHPDPSEWCDVSEADPELACAFSVPYTAVWEWSLYARVETTDGGRVSTDVVSLHSGVSMVRRLVDYSDWERTTTGFGGEE